MTYLNPALPVLLLLLFVALWRKRRGLAAVAAGCLFLWAFPPFAWLLAGTLEWQTTMAKPVPGGAGAIVVLSGNVMSANPPWAEPALAQGSYLRCHYAAWLHRQWPSLPVLASGGRVEGLSFSQAMAQVLIGEGVPAALAWREDASTSTYENALYSARILKAKGIRRIVLVTEAHHMPRAAGCFRKQGLEVVEAPCEFWLLRLEPNWQHLLPAASSAGHNDEILHEWIGIAWYRLSGKL